MATASLHGARPSTRAGWRVSSELGPLASLNPTTTAHLQGNLVNFLRTRGRALVNTPQLLQFSL